MNNSENNTTRPFGFWITAIDRLMADRFATAFENEGLTRRDWRLLNLVADGGDPQAPKIRRLAERGWVTRTSGTWQLTDSGRAAKERLGAVVDGIRAQVAEVVTPEDFAVMTASLENIARAFGYEEGTPLPRRHRGEHRGHRHGGEHREHRFGPHGRGHGHYERRVSEGAPFEGGHRGHGHWGPGRAHWGHTPQVQHIHIHTH
ncbi:MarR family winged helix-turn-helix transcriptional regulator [Microbacterium sp. NPDC057650]|uniref:MarR family winged helix-turn-helix transcriptional regulator n=1 Tax=unclassified Microbacterium TaxID=2609290 RepID=UPI00366EA0AC